MLAVVLTGFGTIYLPVKADSGWDSDYDSGSSSSSDWGGSDYSSSDWSSTGGDYSGGAPSVVTIIVVIIIIVIIVKSNNNRNGSNGSSSSNTSNNITNYKDIDTEKINSIDKDLNIEEFKNKAFNIYKDLQTAWMEFDTDTIRKLTTDEVYNMYSSQLETLKLKKQKNIMKDIELIDAKVIDIRKENNIITVDVYLNVRCYDYVIKEATKEVVRGKDNAKLNIKYKLSFIKSATNNNKEEKCPNCGAPVDIVSSATCPYCDSTLVKTASDYVLSKKTALGQTMER